MGIMTRLTRLFKADVHGVMDQIENKELILKQCLREMESSLLEKQEKLKQLKDASDRIRNKADQCLREKDKIEQDLQIALQKGKDDIARLLIKKRIRTDQQIDDGQRQSKSLDQQMALLAENIEAQKHQLAEMRLRSETWVQKAEYRQWEACISGTETSPSWDLVTDEEVELELIKYKDAVKGGVSDD